MPDASRRGSSSKRGTTNSSTGRPQASAKKGVRAVRAASADTGRGSHRPLHDASRSAEPVLEERRRKTGAASHRQKRNHDTLEIPQVEDGNGSREVASESPSNGSKTTTVLTESVGEGDEGALEKLVSSGEAAAVHATSTVMAHATSTVTTPDKIASSGGDAGMVHASSMVRVHWSERVSGRDSLTSSIAMYQEPAVDIEDIDVNAMRAMPSNASKQATARPVQKRQRVKEAKLNMMRSAVTHKKYRSSTVEATISKENMFAGEEDFVYEWQPLWQTTPLDLAYLGVGVHTYFEFLRILGYTFVILCGVTFATLRLFASGTMIYDESWTHDFFGGMSIGNLGVCPDEGCKDEVELRQRCAYRHDKDCTKVTDIAFMVDTVDALAIFIIIVFGHIFRYIVLPIAQEKASNAFELLNEYTVMVQMLPQYLHGDEGYGTVYALDSEGRLCQRPLKQMTVEDRLWEVLDLQGDLPGGRARTMDVYRDYVYVISDNMAVYRSSLRSLTSWEALTHEACLMEQRKSLQNTCIVDCIRVYRGHVYGIGPGQCILRQDVREMSAVSEWQKASAGNVIHFCFDGGNIYAIDVYHRLVKQRVRKMTAKTRWWGAYGEDADVVERVKTRNFSGCLKSLGLDSQQSPISEGIEVRRFSSIAIEGGWIYGVDLADKNIYRQLLSGVSPEADAWERVSDGSFEVVSIPKESKHKHYAAKVGRHFLNLAKHLDGKAKRTSRRSGASTHSSRWARFSHMFYDQDGCEGVTNISDSLDSEYEARIMIDRTSRRFGIDQQPDCGLRVREQQGGLFIEEVFPGGLVDRWNKAHSDRPNVQVHAGNRIIAVNTATMEPHRMRAELRPGKPRWRLCPTCGDLWKRPKPLNGRCPHCDVDVEDKDLVIIHIDRAVSEVVMVQNLNGAVGKLIKLAHLRKDLENMEALLFEAHTTDLTAASCWRRLQIRVCEFWHRRRQRQAYLLDEELKGQIRDTEAKRGVSMAFVSFSTQQLRKLVLEEYRLSRYIWFRNIQSSQLKFHGYKIQVVEAPDPSNLYWEHLDYPNWKRILRRAFTFAASIVALLACALLITTAQTSSVKTTTADIAETWIFENPTLGTPHCMNLCDLQLFSKSGCGVLDEVETATANIFDAASDHVLGANASWDDAGECGSRWNSSVCLSTGTSDWVGIRFDVATSVKCIRVAQYFFAVVPELRIHACGVPPPVHERGAWEFARSCIPMELVRPTSLADHGSLQAKSGNLRLRMDTSCDVKNSAKAISLEVVKDVQARGADMVGNPTAQCFCRQQVAKDPHFMSPSVTGPEKDICEAWLMEHARNNVLLAVSIVAVVTLNLVLRSVFFYLTDNEMHFTDTNLARSQFIKLFFAQFVNTGLIVLLVHSNIENLPVPSTVSDFVSIGRGAYHEPNQEWFKVVGSSIVVTSFLQIISTTLPEVIRTIAVRLCAFRYYVRTRVTQEALNSRYKLPTWDLPMRLAQSMNVICVIIMYASGMPVLYYIGALYCFVAYWVDKWSLLRGCSKPPAYSQELVIRALDLQPVMVFAHVAWAALIFSNQMLLPSGWSPWVAWSTWQFGLSLEEYEEVTEAWRDTRAPNDKADLYGDFVRARFVDLGRDGAWRVMFILAFYCVYFTLLAVYKMFLKPLIGPIIDPAKEELKSKLKDMKAVQFAEKKLLQWSGGLLSDPFHLRGMPLEDKPPLMDIFPDLFSKGLLTSYSMSANPRYTWAADALRTADHDIKEALANATRSRRSTVRARASSSARSRLTMRNFASLKVLPTFGDRRSSSMPKKAGDLGGVRATRSAA